MPRPALTPALRVAAAVFLLGTAGVRAAPPEFNPLALHVDETLLNRERTDVVLLLDFLGREHERDPARFAANAAGFTGLITDYEQVVARAGPAAAARLAAARAFLAERRQYAPRGELGLALQALAGPAMADELDYVLRSAGWDAGRRSGAFVEQLRAVHRVCTLARQQPALRALVDDALSRAGGQAFRLPEQAEWNERWSALRPLLERAAGPGGTPLAPAELRELLRGVNNRQLRVLDEARQFETQLVDRIQQLRNAVQDPEELDRQISALEPGLPPGARARAERVYTTQVTLALASELAQLGGDPRLARKISAASEFYVKTETFLATLSQLGAKGANFDNSMLMAAATANYVSLALSALSLFGGADDSGGADATRVILEELQEVRRQLVVLGNTMNRRFDLVEFELRRGFEETRRALDRLSLNQQLTAQGVELLGEQLQALQWQTAGWMSRTGGQLSDLGWRKFAELANRSAWSDDMRPLFDDLLTMIAVNSRDRVESGDYDEKSAATEMVATFAGLTQGRLSAAALDTQTVFAKGNFLRRYFEHQYGTRLAPPPAGAGVPNFLIWLRGVGAVDRLKQRFPELSGRPTPEQWGAVEGALDDVAGFWSGLAAAKVGGGAPAYTFENGLFDRVLKRAGEDIVAVHRQVQSARRVYTALQEGFDVWQPWDAEGNVGGFRLTGDEILAQDPTRAGLAAYNAAAKWAVVDDWRAALPPRLSWGSSAAFFTLLFTPEEKLAHMVDAPQSRLEVKLQVHGWSELQQPPGIGARPGKWLITFGLYRGDQLLRTFTIEKRDEVYGDLVPATAPGNGLAFHAPRYNLEMRDGRATAERIWADAQRNVWMTAAGARDLMARAADPANGFTAGGDNAGFTFTLREVVGTATTAEGNPVYERRQATFESSQEKVQEAQRRFIEGFLPNYADLQPALRRYEESRVAFYVLLNLAAPLSVKYNERLAQLLYRSPALPGPRGLVGPVLCGTNENVLDRLPALRQLRALLQAEYRAGKFPQSPEFVTAARDLLAQQRGRR